MEEVEFMSRFELKRQKRKTLTISVKQGNVVVSAPLKMPLADIEKFLSEKSDWINSKLAEYGRKRERFADILDYEAVLVQGKRFPVVRSATVKRIAFDKDKLLLPQKYPAGAQSEKALGTFYKKFALTELKARLDEISASVGIPYNGFSLTNAKGKWGSCDGKDNIMLNWRLYMLSPDIADYVMIHELCHTLEHNHSQKFWANVGKLYPGYKRARLELKNCSVVNELFR